MIAPKNFAQPLAASAPGGPARHFRVQVWEPANNSWRKSGSFRDGRSADAFLLSLLERGYTARMVQFGHLPTAA